MKELTEKTRVGERSGRRISARRLTKKSDLALAMIATVILSIALIAIIKRLFSSSSLSAIRIFIICISEVDDISLGNLDSSLGFIQPGILHDVLCV